MERRDPDEGRKDDPSGAGPSGDEGGEQVNPKAAVDQSFPRVLAAVRRATGSAARPLSSREAAEEPTSSHVMDRTVPSPSPETESQAVLVSQLATNVQKGRESQCQPTEPPIVSAARVHSAGDSVPVGVRHGTVQQLSSGNAPSAREQSSRQECSADPSRIRDTSIRTSGGSEAELQEPTADPASDSDKARRVSHVSVDLRNSLPHRDAPTKPFDFTPQALYCKPFMTHFHRVCLASFLHAVQTLLRKAGFDITHTRTGFRRDAVTTD